MITNAHAVTGKAWMPLLAPVLKLIAYLDLSKQIKDVQTGVETRENVSNLNTTLCLFMQPRVSVCI